MLFTAFEPSGDDHSAVVIRELRRRHPDLPIFAWGGPKMARAGATIIAETGHDAVVGSTLRPGDRVGLMVAADVAVRLVG